MLNCPDCGGALKPTRIETDAPGGTVEVDRCAHCGGVWFDHFEINRMPTHEAMRLSGLVGTGEMSHLSGTGVCPHCGIKLSRLVGTSIPHSAHILHCPHCRGNWVSKKELVKVKQTQDNKLGQFKSLGIPLGSIYTILLPLLILTIISGAIFATVNLVKQTQETRSQAQIRVRELIGTPEVVIENVAGPAQTARIFFTSSAPVTTTLTLTSPNLTSGRKIIMSETPRLLHSVRLTDLTPHTTYSYKITVADENGETSASFTFETP